MAYIICFRGDTRTPYAPDNIFANGFASWDYDPNGPNTQIAPKQDDEFGLSINIESVTGVCVSGRIPGAALFPLLTKGKCKGSPIGPHRLYMMAIDTADIVNTHADQVLIALDRGPALQILPEACMIWLHAHELAVKMVPGRNIIAEIEFTRSWNPPANDWKDGGTYQLEGDIQLNPNCTVADDLKTPALLFLKDERQKHRRGDLANLHSGFHG